MKHTITDLLRAWGAAHRKIPADHDAMRARVLDAARPRTDHVRAPMRPLVPRAALAFAVFAVIAFLVQPEQRIGQLPTMVRRVGSDDLRTIFGELPVYPERSTQSSQEKGAAASEMGIAGPTIIASQYPYPMPPYYPPSRPPITDARELLEWSYHAMLRTRHVEEIGARVQTVIRGHGGRLDHVSLAREYGTVGFALPVDRLDAFRAELATLTRARFLFTENMSAENRLPEQVGIESNIRTTEVTLAEREQERTATADRYRRTIGAQQRAVAEKTTQRDAVRAERDALPADAPERATLAERIRSMEKDLDQLQRELRRLTAERDNRLASFDREIQSIKNSITRLQERETTLQAEVATVQGTVTLQRIAYGALASGFLRTHWLAATLLTIAIVAFYRSRQRLEPLLPR